MDHSLSKDRRCNSKTNLTELFDSFNFLSLRQGVDTLSVYRYISESDLCSVDPDSPLPRVGSLFYVLTCVGFFIIIREGKGSISYLQGAVDSTPVGVFEQALPLFIKLTYWGYSPVQVLCLYSLRFPYTKTQSGYLAHGVRYPDKLTRKSKGG